ncbi:hypothetical protein BGZ54_002855, partial [Gamsiella multidivaricata]
MTLFKSPKKQPAAVPFPAPVPTLAQDDLAPPPYSSQDLAQEKAPKLALKMTQQEALSSLVGQVWGAPDKDIN